MEIRKIFFRVEKMWGSLVTIVIWRKSLLRPLLMLELFTVGILIIRNGTRHLNPLTSLNFSQTPVIHYYLNFLIRTPAGSLITAWKECTWAQAQGWSPPPPLLWLQTRAYYQVDDAYGFLQIRGFNPPQKIRAGPTKVNYRFYLLVSLHLPIFQEYLRKKKQFWPLWKNRFFQNVIYDWVHFWM